MQAKHQLQAFEGEKHMEEESRLIPIHLSKDEVMTFNNLQGSQSVDEQSGLREYSKLVAVLSIPFIRNVFILVNDIIKSGQEIPPDIASLMNQPQPGSEDGIEPIESDFDPEIKQMAMAGGEDNYVVMMPQSIVKFMDSLQGGKHDDPVFGLQKFWDMKDTVKMGGALVGGLIGGPVGAAIGYAGTSAATGSSGKDSLIGGIKAGLMGGMPSMGSMLNAGGGIARDFHHGFMGAGRHGSREHGYRDSGFREGENGKYSADYVGGNQGTQPGGHQWNNQGKDLGKDMPIRFESVGNNREGTGAIDWLSHGLTGAGFLFGHLGEKKAEKERHRVWSEDKAQKEQSRQAAHTHVTLPLAPMPLKNHAYKKGGKVIGVEIKGKGTGQSDDIPRTTKENSWVWDATTVAHAGDGTTNAGQKAIKKFEELIVSKKLPHVKEVIKESIKSKPLRNVPCALSNGERVTPPEIVAAAGDGSFDRGSAILKKMTRELRSHKASKGLELPPAAHDLTVYYKKALRK